MGTAILIAGAVITLILVILCFVFIKRKILAILAANLVIFLASGLLIFAIVEDINDMKQSFPTQEKLFLMTHEGNVLGGFSAVSLDKNLQFLTEEESKAYAANINSRDFSDYENKYYRIITLDSKSLAGFNQIEVAGFVITESEAFSLLDSKTPSSSLAELYMNKQNSTLGTNMQYQAKAAKEVQKQLLEQFGDETAIKTQLFSMMFAQSIKNKGPMYLVGEYKSENLMMYPETITFSLVKIIPQALFEKVNEKLMGSFVPEGK